MPDGAVPKLSHKAILNYEEILRIIKIGSGLGISKIRITGGEPLVRKGIYDFLSLVNKIQGIQDVSITTNGVLLSENLNNLIASGIKRINISLDSLNRQKYKKITGYDFFDQVWGGIMNTLEAGMSPVKINTVIMKGINDDEVKDIASLSLLYPLHIRFIEYMPIGSSCIKDDLHVPGSEIKKQISQLGHLTPVDRQISNEPARRYKFKNAKGEIGFINPLSEPFCSQCNRLRLTATGGLRPCPLSNKIEDLFLPVKAGCSDKDLIDIIIKAVDNKPPRHDLTGDQLVHISSQMSKIGG